MTNIGKRIRNGLGGSALLVALAVMPSGLHAQALQVFGYPSNFDVLNDTGQDVHGFDIELQGITPADLAGVWNYSRFPYTIVATQVGIVIHYASPYSNGQYTIATVVPASFSPTFGHSCVQGAIQGCEHFGYYFGPGKLPSSTVQHWLIDNPANPGTLIQYTGASMQVPVPKVTVSIVNNVPVVAFQIQAEVPRAAQQFGDAKWVKVLKSEVVRNVIVDELLEDNPVVPNDGDLAAVETGWKLLQFNPHSPNSGVLNNQANLGNGSKAVVRKYEFYKFSGAYDPLDHGAICGGDGLCNTPQAGELGDYIGTQMAAVNVGVSSVTVALNGSGSVTGTGAKINCGGTCSSQVALGTAVTLTAKPTSSTVFAGWSGDCAATTLTCSFAVTGENVVTAKFTAAPAGGGGGGGSTAGFKISVSKNGKGTVTANPSASAYPAGTVVTLTATPDPGVPFTGWAGACSGTANTCTLTMDSDKAVTANFR